MRSSPGWKKNAKKDKDYSRRQGKKAPLPLVLIVCEDSVSSPRYLRSLLAKLRLTTVTVEVCGKQCGSAPISVVDYAITESARRKKLGSKVDRIWCVVDVDRHTSIHAALDKAKAHEVDVAISAPCFELWYLLHFVAGGKSYHDYQDLYQDLKRHLPDYDKGSSDPFDLLWPKINDAIERAEKLIKDRDFEKTRHPTKYRLHNPSTEVHELVKSLMGSDKR